METGMVPIAGDSSSSKFPPPDGESSQMLLIPTGTASCDHAQGDGLSARFRPKSHFLCSISPLPKTAWLHCAEVCTVEVYVIKRAFSATGHSIIRPLL
jgi:hypothetical protein